MKHQRSNDLFELAEECRNYRRNETPPSSPATHSRRRRPQNKFYEQDRVIELSYNEGAYRMPATQMNMYTEMMDDYLNHEASIETFDLVAEEQSENNSGARKVEIYPSATAAERTQSAVKVEGVQAGYDETTRKGDPLENLKAQARELSMEDDFAQDLQAILQGEKQYDESTKAAVPARTSDFASSLSSSAPPVSPEQKEEKPKENPHAIFDQMGQNMSMAKTYDLGSFSLQNTFEAFDREMDEEAGRSKKTIEQPVAPLAREAGLQEIDVAEDFELMEVPVQKTPIAETASSEALTAEAFSSGIPLSPESGGRSIPIDVLEIGDVILSTTNADISRKIREATNSPISHCSIYVGDGKVIEATDQGVVANDINATMQYHTVMVAFRHSRMTPQKAQSIKSYLMEQKEKGAQFDYYALIKHLNFRNHVSYCDILPGTTLPAACKRFLGHIFLGTDDNDQFYCSELVFEAFRQAGVPLANIPSNWSTPHSIVELTYNNSLEYIGHLKTS